MICLMCAGVTAWSAMARALFRNPSASRAESLFTCGLYLRPLASLKDTSGRTSKPSRSEAVFTYCSRVSVAENTGAAQVPAGATAGGGTFAPVPVTGSIGFDGGAPGGDLDPSPTEPTHPPTAAKSTPVAHNLPWRGPPAGL